MKSATLMQVAERAGVSTATVARVLKAQGYVSDDARARVEAAVKAIGYRPNAMARGLRQRRSFTIGHMLDAIIVNPFFVNVAHWAEEEALDHGYKTFLFNHNGLAERERIGIERFIERRVDAVLFTNAVSTENVRLLKAAGIPALQLERSRTPAAPAIRVDNTVGALQAMAHLAGLGHRRIAFIGGDPELIGRGETAGPTVEDDRLAAYGAGLAAAGLPFDPALLRLGKYYSLSESGSGSEGYHHTRALLALDDRPTAIFATCDILAAGALQAIYEAGLRVPDDISVIGFDDTLAANLTPQLTTVAQPMEQLGRIGFRAVLAAIETGAWPEQPLLPSHLVLRRSTGPAPL
ncbi:LacI family transcriptional regulator [Mesorhizobium sp. BR1-1-16]|uniref:LacI family DNA-binding transcriptional regulator n=1 Tax=Mesorhizobium sp. BR1-1-16 TaxID=2876653 RepID=UPI001CC9389E|nr:LacI family DNA-binding transcriptional regulator [Mesorhizobium sp. BR1-1-16]MBZ9938904.1 LacI family transcriptional regulator [Mesorhizobium sp. BR1-1-16]